MSAIPTAVRTFLILTLLAAPLAACMEEGEDAESQVEESAEEDDDDDDDE